MSRLRVAGALLAMAIWGSMAATALGKAGDLDPSFGSGGKATFAQGPNDGTAEIDLQADGKIVAGVTAGGNLGVIRVTPQGAIDTSFGSGGLAQADLGGSETGGLAVVGPGGIYAAGTSSLSAPTRLRLGFARFNPQGQVVTSFSSRYDLLSASTNDQGHGLAIAPNGSVLVSGDSNGRNASVEDPAVARLSSDGVFDSGFGANGGASVPLGGGTNAAFSPSVAGQQDGKVVLGANAFSGGVFVIRFTSAGSPDGSFGTTGQVGLPGMTTGGAVAIQPDGKLLVAGGDGSDAVVERLTSGGGLDATFSGDGRATVDFGATDVASDVALQPDGKIVIAGTAASGDQSDFGVARLQPNGSLDTTFGDGGVSRVDFEPGDAGNALAIQPDGKIVVGGESGASVVNPPFSGTLSMIRLQGDPGGAAKKAKCGGKKATVVGTKGKDRLKGTRKRDVIAGLGGKDKIKGLKGNDLICGGNGKDKLVGGPGKDKLLGQGGNDILIGGPGKDTLKGGPGKRDKLNGGPGKDVQKP